MNFKPKIEAAKNLFIRSWPTYLNGMPDWKIKSQKVKIQKSNKIINEKTKTILIATSVGGFLPGLAIESMLGLALTARNAEVAFLICDAQLPACLQVHYKKINGTKSILENKLSSVACDGCFSRGSKVLESTKLKIYHFSDFINPTQKKEIKLLSDTILLDKISAFCINQTKIGEHALAGALRFFSRGQLPQDNEGEQILRRYFEAALIAYEVAKNCLQYTTPECCLMNHGIYVPHGIISEVAKSMNVRSVIWNVAYKKQCFLFSHNETYHHSLLTEPVANWEHIKWTKKLNKQLMKYLKSRWTGKNDWIWFHAEPKTEIKNIAKEIGFDLKKPIVTALTNVFWDAQLHYKANAFKNMLEWLEETIAYFSTRTDLQLVIRIHPAEVRGAIPSRQPIEEELQKIFKKIPKNIFIISPQNQASTYVLCQHSNCVIIYGTKTGVEISTEGIPVIVAGEAWIKNKGITHDVSSKNEYLTNLKKLPFSNQRDIEKIVRAKKYAYHFFFRRFIPLRFVKHSLLNPPFQIKMRNCNDLLSGVDQGLDTICNGILHGNEFIFEAEKKRDKNYSLY